MHALEGKTSGPDETLGLLHWRKEAQQEETGEAKKKGRAPR